MNQDEERDCLARGAAVFNMTPEAFIQMVEPHVAELARITRLIERAKSPSPSATPPATPR
jgi:hypothetical protein